MRTTPLLFCLLVGSLRSEVPQSPAPQALLRVSLPEGKNTFSIGEPIPLRLEFSGRAEADYSFTTRNYDRSGRLDIERYVIEPAAGVEDPLDDYYRGGFFGFIGGGLSGWHQLDGSPFVLEARLNEWVRFTRPGRYRLTVVSKRLERHSRQPAPELRAAPIDLVIEPLTDVDAKRMLDEALQAVDTGGAAQATTGFDALRYLGTPDAARAMVDRYGSLYLLSAFKILAGLIASPHRSLIVSRMEDQLAKAPRLAPEFIRNLSYLRLMMEFPRGTADYAQRKARFDQLVEEYEKQRVR